MKTSSRAALIRKIEKEMDRVDVTGHVSTGNGATYDTFQEGIVNGKLEGLGYALWLLKDTADL